MQSIFRLPAMPWSPNALDKSAVLIPDTTINGKRKRIAESQSQSQSPKPLAKKLKIGGEGGAVQSLSEQALRRIASQADAAQHASMTVPTGVNLPRALSGENPKTMLGVASGSRGFTNSPVLAPSPPQKLAPGPAPLAVSSLPVTHGVTTMTGRTPLLPVTIAPVQPSPGCLQKESVTMLPSPVTPTVLTTPAATPAATPTQLPNSATLQPTLPLVPSEAKPKCINIVKPTMKVDTDTLRAIVEMEINNAILLKHNEMRLIDQEIGKCQIALEQIRRCEIIPRPAQQIPSFDLTNHTGLAVLNSSHSEYSIPDSPAPWGVTDGPYSRHYATWLLPSKRFDPQSPTTATTAAFPSPLLGRDGSRSTRGSVLEPVTTPYGSHSVSRPSRSITGRVRASNTNDPSSPLTPRDPLVIKRQKDGVFVKLYCSHCNPERSDFANVQGFLNHCRISHKLDFKSHEAAAIECGRPVEAGDYFSAQALEPQVPLSATPQAAQSREVRTPFSASFSFAPPETLNTRTTSVHQLNKACAKLRDPQVIPRSLSTSASDKSKPRSTTTPAPASFVAAKETPFLSTLLSKRGFAGNMSHIVTQAKSKVDLSEYSDESESETAVGSTDARGKFKSKSKAKAKGKGKPNVVTSSTVRNDLIDLMTRANSVEDEHHSLSPNTATDYSNPGLVSDRDDEEYEEDDADPLFDRVPGSGSTRGKAERVVIVDMMETESSTSNDDNSIGDTICTTTRS